MVCNNGGIYGFLGAWWVLINMVPCSRVFQENLVGLGSLFVSYIKSIPTHENSLKTTQMPPFNLFLLGLGRPRVGEFVGFILIFFMFSNPTELSKSQTP